MKIYIDWGREKDNVIFSEKNEFLEEVPEGSTVFVESGTPPKDIYEWHQKGCEIFIVDGRDVNAYRESKGMEKYGDFDDDVRDAILIRDYIENGGGCEKVEETKEKERIISFISRLWFMLEKTQTTMTNRIEALQKAYSEEVAEKYLETQEFENYTKRLEEEKNELMDYGKQIAGEKVEKLTDFDGIGRNNAVKLIGEADPEDFDALSAYLRYLGFTEETQFKSNGFAKSTIWLMAKQGWNWKVNTKWRELYEFFYDNGHSHQAAVNRLCTFIAKEIYYKIREEEAPEEVNLIDDAL